MWLKKKLAPQYCLLLLQLSFINQKMIWNALFLILCSRFPPFTTISHLFLILFLIPLFSNILQIAQVDVFHKSESHALSISVLELHAVDQVLSPLIINKYFSYPSPPNPVHSLKLICVIIPEYFSPCGASCLQVSLSGFSSIWRTMQQFQN